MRFLWSNGGHIGLVHTGHKGAWPLCLRWFLNFTYSGLPPCQVAKTCHHLLDSVQIEHIPPQLLGGKLGRLPLHRPHYSTSWVFSGPLGSPEYENQMPPANNWNTFAVLVQCLEVPSKYYNSYQRTFLSTAPL